GQQDLGDAGVERLQIGGARPRQLLQGRGQHRRRARRAVSGGLDDAAREAIPLGLEVVEVRGDLALERELPEELRLPLLELRGARSGPLVIESGRSSTPSSLFWHMITARSMTFLSSRTLPGQG